MSHLLLLRYSFRVRHSAHVQITHLFNKFKPYHIGPYWNGKAIKCFDWKLLFVLIFRFIINRKSKKKAQDYGCWNRKNNKLITLYLSLSLYIYNKFRKWIQITLSILLSLVNSFKPNHLSIYLKILWLGWLVLKH